MAKVGIIFKTHLSNIVCILTYGGTTLPKYLSSMTIPCKLLKILTIHVITLFRFELSGKFCVYSGSLATLCVLYSTRKAGELTKDSKTDQFSLEIHSDLFSKEYA